MNTNTCKIQMLDLYFSKFDFKLERGTDSQEYSTSFRIEYATNSEDDTKVRIIVDTTVENETQTVVLNVQAVGIFKVDKVDIDEATYEHLIKANTVAIIFPFIRSQVSLLTTQPGMTPVIIPPININALIESQN